jgi:hypothetical protein
LRVRVLEEKGEAAAGDDGPLGLALAATQLLVETQLQ